MSIVALLFAAVIGQGAPSDAAPDPAPAVDEFEVEEVAAPERVAELPQPVATLTRGLALPNATIAKAGVLQFTLDHRAFQSINAGNGIGQDLGEDFLGLDKGLLKIALGLRFSPADWVDASFTRQNGVMENFDTYETMVRLKILDQEQAGADLTAGVGFDWFQQPDIQDATSGLALLALDTQELAGFQAGGVMMLAIDSTGPNKNTEDEGISVAAGGSLRYSFVKSVALQLEGAYTVMGYAEAHPYLAGGLTFRTVGHVFSLVLANTQYLTIDALAAGGYMAVDKPLFGFSIIREWNVF